MLDARKKNKEACIENIKAHNAWFKSQQLLAAFINPNKIRAIFMGTVIFAVPQFSNE